MRKIEPRNTACYCIKVRRAANAVTKYYDKALEAVGLTVSQYSLLTAIKSLDGCNKSELAAYTKLDRTTIIRNLNTLLEKGLIIEEPGNDNRNNVVQLTELGETSIAEGRSHWKQAQAEFRATVGVDSIEDFVQTLARIESLG